MQGAGEEDEESRWPEWKAALVHDRPYVIQSLPSSTAGAGDDLSDAQPSSSAEAQWLGLLRAQAAKEATAAGCGAWRPLMCSEDMQRLAVVADLLSQGWVVENSTWALAMSIYQNWRSCQCEKVMSITVAACEASQVRTG